MRIWFSDLGRLRVKLPSVTEQRRIAAVLETCDREIDLLEQQLEALKEQKRGLVQKLLTGKAQGEKYESPTQKVETGGKEESAQPGRTRSPKRGGDGSAPSLAGDSAAGPRGAALRGHPAKRSADRTEAWA